MFEEVDKLRSSHKTELASQARRVMHFFIHQAKSGAGFWELQVQGLLEIKDTYPPRTLR